LVYGCRRGCGSTLCSPARQNSVEIRIFHAGAHPMGISKELSVAHSRQPVVELIEESAER